MEPMKINWGSLREIPEISINRFGGAHTAPEQMDNSVVRAYFLTHCEMETLEDLFQSTLLSDMDVPVNGNRYVRYPCPGEETGEKRLYMHEMTYQFLIYWTTTPFVKKGHLTLFRLLKLKQADKIIFLPIHVPIQIEFTRPGANPGTYIPFCFQVTALSAGYDIGSIMLLFESMGQRKLKSPWKPWIMNDVLRIVYTGNCRVHMKDLIRAKPLFQGLDGLGKIKPIHVLYLDTKFFLPHVEELPTRRQVTKKLVKEVSRKLREDPNTSFGFSTQARIGNLHFFQMFMDLTDERFHVPNNLSRYFRMGLNGMKSTALDGVTARLHYDCEGWEKRNEDDPTKIYTSVGDMCRWEAGETIISRTKFIHVALGFTVSFPEKYPRAPMTNDEICWGQGKRVWSDLAPPTRRNPKTPIKVLHGIYINNLSRYEAVRLIQFLKPNLILPLYQTGDFTKDELRKLICSSCSENEALEEPKWIQQAYPSYAHDFTASVDNRDDGDEDEDVDVGVDVEAEKKNEKLLEQKEDKKIQVAQKPEIPTALLIDF